MHGQQSTLNQNACAKEAFLQVWHNHHQQRHAGEDRRRLEQILEQYNFDHGCVGGQYKLDDGGGRGVRGARPWWPLLVFPLPSPRYHPHDNTFVHSDDGQHPDDNAGDDDTGGSGGRIGAKQPYFLCKSIIHCRSFKL